MEENLYETDFNIWYHQIVEEAGLCDKRYSIKGMNVWLPYGWRLMKNIDSIIREEMESTGHDEVSFPLMISRTDFAKEAEHIKGFDAQVYWVTHGGLNELDVPMLLRPTSETAMYPLFALWIRSHTDLPLKIYQIVNTFRYETKMTRAFIRVREIHFFESHTAHTSYEDAEEHIMTNLGIAHRYCTELALPYILIKRPDWDKFAGADYTVGLDTFLPSGKSLQLASIHQYRDNFSRAYDIKYEDENGEHQYVHQTTYGMSERSLGAVIGVHGDVRGLKIPPSVAPIQVVIVPIIQKKTKELVETECATLVEELEAAGYRVKLDDRDLRPGNKYYHWEFRGVPLRIEIGPRDIEAGHVILSRRDKDTDDPDAKATVKRTDLVETIAITLTDIQDSLLSSAKEFLDASMRTFKTIEKASEAVDEDVDFMVRTGWCGADYCGHDMEDTLDMTMLGTVMNTDNEPAEEMNCASCGSPGHVVLLSKTY